MVSKSKIFLVYFLVFIVTLIMSALQINFGYIILVMLIIVTFGLVLPLLKVIFWETNIENIEKFLISKKSDPNYMLIYATANKLDEEVEVAINKLLKKYKAKHKQSLYKVIYAFYKNEILTAKEEVQFIKPDNYMHYYNTIMLVEEGKMSEAEQSIEKISIPWMKSALLAEIANRLNDHEKANAFAKEALSSSKGIQKYTLYKNFEREFPMLNL